MEVRGKAFSSAANYVFTAGEKQIPAPRFNAGLAWRRGAKKTDFITKILMFKYISNAQKTGKGLFQKNRLRPTLGYLRAESGI